MANSSWVETKRDADLDESGKPIVKKVQLEPAGFTGKNKIDLVLRIIGLAAIITPIVLVYLQQKASLNTQKAIKQLDIYSTLATELSSISRRPVNSAAFIASKEELAYTLPPKVAFLFREEASTRLEEINSLIPVYESIAHHILIIAALYEYGNVAASIIGSYRSEGIPYAFPESHEVMAYRNTFDSCCRELVHQFTELTLLVNNVGMTDTSVVSSLRQVLSVDQTLLQSSAELKAAMENTYDVLISKKNPSANGNKAAFEILSQRHKKLLGFSRQLGDDGTFKSCRRGFTVMLKGKIDSLQTNMRKLNTVFRD